MKSVILEDFKALVDHSADVSIISVKDFDPRNRYRDLVKTVESTADGGHIQVYRLDHGTTRAEYFLVAVDKGHSRLVGVKAKAVES